MPNGSVSATFIREGDEVSVTATWATRPPRYAEFLKRSGLPEFYDGPTWLESPTLTLPHGMTEEQVLTRNGRPCRWQVRRIESYDGNGPTEIIFMRLEDGAAGSLAVVANWPTHPPRLREYQEASGSARILTSAPWLDEEPQVEAEDEFA